MPTNLPRLIPSSNPNDRVVVQDTDFTTDVVGRFVCNTWDEAIQNGGVAFDAVVIGAGMFGAYFAEKLFRNSNMRVLVLDAGSLLVTEHVQNLARIGINNAGAAKVEFNSQDPGTREWVWGNPWRSRVAFPGLAYCLGGRSLFWGGWSPQLTEADLLNWPAEVAHYLRNIYPVVEREMGVFDKTDYISGPLFDELFKKFKAVKPSVSNVDEIEEAPLAVQAAPPASGLFSFDKWSSAPIFVDAVRDAAGSPDWQRRLFYVPRAHVTRLNVTNGVVTNIEVRVNGQPKLLNVSPQCAVVLASGTIESTRLALDCFPTPLMGRNLVAHLRSNTVIRIKRSALSTTLPQNLEAAALLVRGSTPQGRFHLQVTAASVAGANSEATLWRMIPDIELLDKMLASQSSDWIVITLRGIGEMIGDRDPNKPKTTGSAPSWLDLSDQTDEFALRRAWVNIATTQADGVLWKTMDEAALALAKKLVNDDADAIEYFYNKNGSQNDPGSAWHKDPPPPSLSADRNNANNKVRDGLGTTHHEAGTLWMGSDPNTSVTNLDGRFHHVANAYVAGPGLFPTLGSHNPSLTGLALARRTALAIVRDTLAPEQNFIPVGNGGLAGWQMAGSGRFMELGGSIIESVDGIGLLWFTKEQFDDFILRVDFRLNSLTDNSGVFIRIPALGTSDPANDWKPATDQGYEIQIDNTGYNPDSNTTGDLKHATGAIYKLAATSGSMPAVGQWHTVEIEAVGPKITVSLNGQQVSQLTNGNRLAKGFIGLQNHHPGSKVQFTRMRIKKFTTAQPEPVLLDAGRRGTRSRVPA
jgi:choline dehydrogenase-like flavoprotein